MTLHLGYMRIMNFNVCLFLCVVVAVVIAICVLVFMWICLMCAKKIARPHTRTRCGTHAHIKYAMPTHLHVVRNARPHAHIFLFFSVCCYEKSGFYIILCTPFYWAIIFFLYFFLTNVENGREKLGKKSTSLFAYFLF